MQDADIFVTALLKAHEEDLDYESKQALGVTENIKYKGLFADTCHTITHV